MVHFPLGTLVQMAVLVDLEVVLVYIKVQEQEQVAKVVLEEVVVLMVHLAAAVVPLVVVAVELITRAVMAASVIILQ
jgi:hypothetical protein